MQNSTSYSKTTIVKSSSKGGRGANNNYSSSNIQEGGMISGRSEYDEALDNWEDHDDNVTMSMSKTTTGNGSSGV